MTLPHLSPFEARYDTAWPVQTWRDSHVVLAVSGGADSVAMLRAALRLKEAAGGSGTLFVAHFHHGLRGNEANADEAWLAVLCRDLNVPLEVERADVSAIATRQGDGWEAAARTARYDFLRRTAERLGARYLSTAHTATDQAETVLHRILRGTGLAGLRGISHARALSPSVSLVRPLLSVTRAEVLEYLTGLGQDYRTDSTNANVQWTRNRLRHELLPLLRQQFNADVDDALVRLATQAHEAQHVIGELADRLAKECVSVQFGPDSAAGDCVSNAPASSVRIDCRSLLADPPNVMRELCKIAWTQAHWPQQAMGFDQWQQLAELIAATGDMPSVNLPGNVRAHKSRQILLLEAFLGNQSGIP